MTISHYGPGSYNNPPPARSRILLLHKREIRKLLGATTQKGLTVVPLEVYFKDGLAKVAIALAKAKKAHDKREDLKRRVAEREMRSEEHTSELQSQSNLVCRLLLEKKKKEKANSRQRTAHHRVCTIADYTR